MRDKSDYFSNVDQFCVKCLRKTLENTFIHSPFPLPTETKEMSNDRTTLFWTGYKKKFSLPLPEDTWVEHFPCR